MWHCADGGYQWETLEPIPLRWVRGQPTEVPSDTRYLVERKMERPRYRRYNPFVSEPTLYREFGRLERTEDAVDAEDTAADASARLWSLPRAYTNNELERVSDALHIDSAPVVVH